jgi:hypothetical protein
MNTAKIYHDANGNECTIFQMVKREPEWAATRIQEGEKAIVNMQWIQPADKLPGTSVITSNEKIICSESTVILLSLDSEPFTGKYCHDKLVKSGDIDQYWVDVINNEPFNFDEIDFWMPIPPCPE